MAAEECIIGIFWFFEHGDRKNFLKAEFKVVFVPVCLIIYHKYQIPCFQGRGGKWWGTCVFQVASVLGIFLHPTTLLSWFI